MRHTQFKSKLEEYNLCGINILSLFRLGIVLGKRIHDKNKNIGKD